MNRVMAFLDGAYLFKGVKAVMGDGWRLDFDKFVAAVVGPRQLNRTYFYNAWLTQDHDPARFADQQRFLSYLRNLDYFTMRNGRLAGEWPRVRQKGVDVRLALDMVKFAYKGAYDVAALVSGDSDLVEAVRSVQENGQHVELWHFNTGSARTADELHSHCDVRRTFTQEFLAPLSRA